MINVRKWIEQVFGWIKQAASLRQLKARGRSKIGTVFRLHVVAYNLIRITNLPRSQAVMAFRCSQGGKGTAKQAECSPRRSAQAAHAIGDD